ncbi:MAG TPA: hypothetical protein VGB01_06380 [candidate division Zixibacteria bacterium]
MPEKILVTIDSNYHRYQFDDWLAGGSVEYKGKIYHWFAQNNNYGLGWEIEPISEEDFVNIREEQFDAITKLIERCLNMHKTDYTFFL